MNELFERHLLTLNGARAALASREYWSAYPESPAASVYGKDAREKASEELRKLRGERFEIADHPCSSWAGEEESPFGGALGITYPTSSIQELLQHSAAAGTQWAAASVEARVGLCLEILAQLNQCSHLIGHACSQTTGQPLVMAFQAGGPHAQERGLEAVASAYEEMIRVPPTAHWVKPRGKAGPLEVDKSFHLRPRGISVAIACSTFPTWNSYPGIFASLATGNTLLIKPHPAGVLPLALTVRVMRGVLRDQGFDPNVVLLAVDTRAAPIAAELALRPEVKVIDFTGGPKFGSWLREHARQALVFTEEAGVNSVIIDGTDDFQGMCRNLALSLSLYSGQMCTAPQNLLIPRDGIQTNEGHRTFAQVAGAISEAVAALLSDPGRAEGILGAIQSKETLTRIKEVSDEGPVLLQSKHLVYPSFPSARTATPLIRSVRASDTHYFMQEMFGPISYAIATDSTEHSMQLAGDAARRKGAISMALYTLNGDVVTRGKQLAIQVGVNLSINLTGPDLFVNQNGAFSDYHVSGANPAGTACFTDSAFIAGRFRIVGSRTVCSASRAVAQ